MSEVYKETGSDTAGLPPQSKAIITNIFQIDSKTLEQLAVWLEGRGLNIPLGQITGYGNLTQSARVALASNLTAGASGTVNWTSETFDSGGLFDPNNNTKLTVGTPGKYIIGGGLVFNANGVGGNRTMAINLAGTTAVTGMRDNNASTTQQTIFGTVTIMDCAAGDFFTLSYSQSSGSNVTIPSDARTNFWIARVTS